MDTDGDTSSITDRISDVIIRGGENISAAEVEEILMAIPGVFKVAVMAAPDARMGQNTRRLSSAWRREESLRSGPRQGQRAPRPRGCRSPEMAGRGVWHRGVPAHAHLEKYRSSYCETDFVMREETPPGKPLSLPRSVPDTLEEAMSPEWLNAGAWSTVSNHTDPLGSSGTNRVAGVDECTIPNHV